MLLGVIQIGLDAVAVDGATFGLVEGWDQLKLPPAVNGKSLGAVLRRLPYRQQLIWPNTRPEASGSGPTHSETPSASGLTGS